MSYLDFTEAISIYQMMACATGSKRLRDYEEKNLPLKKRPLKEIPYMDTALLLDDDIPSRLMEQSMLASLGIDTLAVNNVRGAIDILLVGGRFDFIIADFDLAIISGPQVSTPFFILNFFTLKFWHFERIMLCLDVTLAGHDRKVNNLSFHI